MPVSTSGPRRQQISTSLLLRRLGPAGIFQMSSSETTLAQEDIEVRSDSNQLLAKVQEATLGATEVDVLTWLCAQWARSNLQTDGSLRPNDGKVKTTIHGLARQIYVDSRETRDGEAIPARRVSGGDRARVAAALRNLTKAVVTIGNREAFEQHQGEGLPALPFSDVHFIERINYGPELMALRAGQEVPPAAFGGLRDETIEIQLGSWLTTELDEEQMRTWLAFATQRRLGSGMGKRLWMLLETHRDYQPLFEDDQLEMAVLPLAPVDYRMLQANCTDPRDNRKAIQRGLKKIIEEDDRYVAKDAGRSAWCKLTAGRGGKPDLLQVVRLRSDPLGPTSGRVLESTAADVQQRLPLG